MGDRYILTVRCPCGYSDDNVHFAPSSGLLTWKCPECKNVINLEDYSKIKLLSIIDDKEEE